MPHNTISIASQCTTAMRGGLVLAAVLTTILHAESNGGFGLATFSVDVTIPLGHPCMGGGIAPAREVADALLAKGFVLTGSDKPFVVISFDWCEIRATSYEKWKHALAEAARTDPARVLV